MKGCFVSMHGTILGKISVSKLENRLEFLYMKRNHSSKVRQLLQCGVDLCKDLTRPDSEQCFWSSLPDKR